MSKHSEIKKLLRTAAGQGFTWSVSGAGHYRVVAPDGRDTTIAHTPRNDGAVVRAEADLRRIGLRSRRPPKPKTVTPPPPSPQQEGTPVPTFGEVVRVTPARDTPQDDLSSLDEGLMAVEEIPDNLSLAAYLVWESIMDEVRSSETRRHVYHGVDGWEWDGSRQRMITKLWPTLDPPDYDRNPPSMPIERRLLGAYLSGSRNMALLRSGDAGIPSRWWVRENWAEVGTDEAMQRSQEPERGGSRRVPRDHEPATPAITTVTDLPELHHCPDCAFVTRNLGSLVTHRARLTGKTHLTGNHPCPVEGCYEVRSDPVALGNHIARDHRALGLVTCRICGDVFSDNRERVDHQIRIHDSFRRTTVEREPDPAPVPTPAQITAPPRKALEVPFTPPAASNGDDPLAYLQKVLGEVAELRTQAAEVPALKETIRILRDENATLRERNAQIAEWLRAYPLRKEFDVDNG